MNIVCSSGHHIRGGERDALFQFKSRISADVTKRESAIAVDLAAEEESEAAERAVRLRVLKKIVNRRAETKSLPDEQRKLRLEFERQKLRNRDIVNRWRTRVGKHRTVHHLDRSERIRSENRTIEDKLDGMVREVLVMKARFEDLLNRHQLMMQSSGGKRRLLPQGKITEINNWLGQVPGMLQKVADSQATPARNERKRPVSSEGLVRESRKTIRLSTQRVPLTVFAPRLALASV